MDVNSIKAGKYQLVAERWDEPTSKPGEPFTFRRHVKGDIVQLSEDEARRLVTAGAVVEPGTLEKAAAEAALRQYQALLAQVPEELRGELRDQLAAMDPESSGEPSTSTQEPGIKPGPTSPKSSWVDYAVAHGMEKADAEKLTRDQLAARFETGA